MSTMTWWCHIRPHYAINELKIIGQCYDIAW